MRIKDAIMQLKDLGNLLEYRNTDAAWNDDLKAIRIAIAVLSEIDKFVPGYMPGKDVKSCGEQQEKS